MGAEPLRVGLDLTPTITASTGVARYARLLHQSLRAEGVVTRSVAIGRGSFPPPAGTRRFPVPLRVVRAAWRHARLPRLEWLTGTVDVVHALDGQAPPSGRPVVVTVHDTVALDLPDLHHPRLVAQQRAQVATAARVAVVVADTQATADSLVRHGLRGVPVVVAHLGLTPLPEPSPTPSGVERDLARPFVLFVGEIARRKGHDLIVEALADPALRDLALVVVGPGDPAPIAAAAARFGVTARVRLAGTVDDATLAGLYRRATLLCLPSRAEGFGLPVLEAMATGLPVVISDAPALVEVAGDAARVVPVGDVGALAAAVAEVAGDPALRARLAGAGRRRAADFDWRRTARRTIEAYELACR